MPSSPKTRIPGEHAAMTMIGFKNTNNQTVYVNPAQVLYVIAYEPDVSVIAFAATGPGGQPAALHVRGSVDLVQSKLSGTIAPRG